MNISNISYGTEVRSQIKVRHLYTRLNGSYCFFVFKNNLFACCFSPKTFGQTTTQIWN